MNKRFLRYDFRVAERQYIKVHAKARLKSPNSFILYRQHMGCVFKRMETRKRYSKIVHSSITSEILGFLWNYEAADVKGCYETLADLERLLDSIRRPRQPSFPKDIMISRATFGDEQLVKEGSQECFDYEQYCTTPSLLDSFDILKS